MNIRFVQTKLCQEDEQSIICKSGYWLLTVDKHFLRKLNLLISSSPYSKNINDIKASSARLYVGGTCGRQWI